MLIRVLITFKRHCVLIRYLFPVSFLPCMMECWFMWAFPVCFASVVSVMFQSMHLTEVRLKHYNLPLPFSSPLPAHTHSEVEPETLTAVIAKEIRPRSLTTARLLQGIIRSKATPTATPTTPHQRKSMGGALSTPRRHSIGNTPLRGGSSFSALGQNLLPTVVEAGERSK